MYLSRIRVRFQASFSTIKLLPSGDWYSPILYFLPVLDSILLFCYIYYVNLHKMTVISITNLISMTTIK